MATLLLTTVGTLVGGPIGGAIGALAGQQIDHAIIGSPRREGPRLKELQVTTSSYGTPLPRHFGRVRTAGTLIWATKLSESSESSGGKGRPSLTTYSYSASFAVAISSRPIMELRRIWADGNLLRGAAGDLKVGGSMRLHDGHGDEPVDPLIAADMGLDCPAFRNTAYVVFEDLQLADFGNRIPALTFEIVADDGEIGLEDVLEPLTEPTAIARSLTGLSGYSFDGGSYSALLAGLNDAWPFAIDAGKDELAILSTDIVPDAPSVLPEPACSTGEDTPGRNTGMRLSRGAGNAEILAALRYYDTDRDFQAGVQRADGRARPGRNAVIELPGALTAETARSLINAAADRASWSRDTLIWRVAQLDPSHAPGTIARVPYQPGLWLISGWEWREHGVELELLRLPRGPARQTPADAGAIVAPPDQIATPTLLQAFELPWDGMGNGDDPAIFAAPSSTSAGWGGAALFAEAAGQLTPLGGSGSRRAVIGQISTPLPGSPALRLEQNSEVEIDVASTDLGLSSTGPEEMASGANRVLVGKEVLQFALAASLGAGRWRLKGLLRGRGGTEAAARIGHPAGTAFALLDQGTIALDSTKAGATAVTSIVAIGRGDAAPVSAPIVNRGITLRPHCPVHASAESLPDGGLRLRWTRRARGAWNWLDEVEVPLAEQTEAYRVGVGSIETPALVWDTSDTQLLLTPSALLLLQTQHPGASIWVRQIGSFAQSDALLLTTIS